ncbi:MAG: hypothetical protein AMXMBFR33_35720 [Candidatus Xenobia bacterium]
MCYAMKDLGYARTPTSAEIHLELPDGSVWAVPVQVVVDSRDENYREDEEDTVGSIRQGTLDVNDVWDWAFNNMNWDELHPYRRQVRDAEPLTEKVFDNAWCEGEGNKQIVGEV